MNSVPSAPHRGVSSGSCVSVGRVPSGDSMLLTIWV